MNMKVLNTIFLFVSFFLTIQANAQSKCQETKYQLFRQGQLEQQTTKTYDTNGNLLTQLDAFASRANGNYTTEYNYEYDEKGNNTQVLIKQNGRIQKTIQKTYNSAGNLISETAIVEGKKAPLASLAVNNGETVQVFYAQDGVTEVTKEKTTLNKAGQLLKKEILNASGKVIVSETKTYDLQGNITQSINFDATNKVTETTNYQYDAKENLLNDKTLRNDETFAETNYEYNAAGKLSKKTRLNGKNQVDYYFTYEYDLQGKMSKETYFYNNDVVSVRTFEYDLQGNKIKESYLDKGGNTTMYKVWEFACK
jgi:YD repeat-containing protein